MKIIDLIKELDLVKITDSFDENTEFTGVYIGDLLSLVVSRAKQGDLWITIQTHINVVAVADLLDLSAILVAEGMEIDEDTIIKANDLGLPILQSQMSAYELACGINRLGI
ncbi:MAG TPA: serine kinase [Clostridiales bacterium]|nr:serine kinase [Clostridiales bacterium]